jgi:hypothetical protein
VDEILGRCLNMCVKVSHLGSLRGGSGLIVDNKRVDEQARIDIDELYGSFKSSTS